LAGGKAVGNDTTGIGKGRRAKCASKEAQYDNSLDVLSGNDAGIETREASVCNDEEDLATKEL